MIFVTVGSMFAFDRLIIAADGLASRRLTEQFVAQVGQSRYAPRFMQSTQMMTSTIYAETVRTSKLVVAHVGMGSVISALEAEKPIVVLPRKSALREATTDHQIATAKWLQQKRSVYVAWDESAVLET